MSLTIPHISRWDKKWRVVFFSIPDQSEMKSTNKRQELRNHLLRLKFIQLQKGVWIHPFPCKEIVEKIAEKLNILDYIKIGELINFSGQKEIVEKFKILLKRRRK